MILLEFAIHQEMSTDSGVVEEFFKTVLKTMLSICRQPLLFMQPFAFRVQTWKEYDTEIRHWDTALHLRWSSDKRSSQRTFGDTGERICWQVKFVLQLLKLKQLFEKGLFSKRETVWSKVSV